MHLAISMPSILAPQQHKAHTRYEMPFADSGENGHFRNGLPPCETVCESSI